MYLIYIIILIHLYLWLFSFPNQLHHVNITFLTVHNKRNECMQLIYL